jgi:epoxyqueuosine reductase
MLGASWLESIPLLLDREIEPDEPSIELGCPSWCKNACLAACPTGALYAPKKMNPPKCIAYNTYYGSGITPLELREPMGAWVYGCDRCQNVCPRNSAWLAALLSPNEKAFAKVPDFEPVKLLHMDRSYFEQKIWPHMFYMSADEIWRWKMNTARSLGNTRDENFVPELVRAFGENSDERVRSMCAWALGRIGGKRAKKALEGFRGGSGECVNEEVEYALNLSA